MNGTRLAIPSPSAVVPRGLSRGRGGGGDFRSRNPLCLKIKCSEIKSDAARFFETTSQFRPFFNRPGKHFELKTIILVRSNNDDDIKRTIGIRGWQKSPAQSERALTLSEVTKLPADVKKASGEGGHVEKCTRASQSRVGGGGETGGQGERATGPAYVRAS